MRIGVDVGGTTVGIGLLNNSFNIIKSIIIPTKKIEFEYIVKDIFGAINKILCEYSIDIADINSIGIGLPGYIDYYDGIFINAPNINVSNFPIIRAFKQEFNTRIAIDNDANCAALAEYKLGALKVYKDCLLITIGTGIGGGIIQNGEVVRGYNYFFGEVGHMVINKDGKKCGCGRKGCWEQYASISALKEITQNQLKRKKSLLLEMLDGDINNITSEYIFKCAKEGDAVSINILNEFYENIGIGLVNIINMLNPEAIAIGGGVSQQGMVLIEPIVRYVSLNSLYKKSIPKILTARFTNDAGVIGAALL